MRQSKEINKSPSSKKTNNSRIKFEQFSAESNQIAMIDGYRHEIQL